MVSERRAASRPSVAAGFIIDRDDEFPYDHAVCKRYGSPLTLSFTVYYEARYQTFVDRANIANRVLNDSLLRSIAISLWMVAIFSSLSRCSVQE